jgi:hypothetical protein
LLFILLSLRFGFFSVHGHLFRGRALQAVEKGLILAFGQGEILQGLKPALI